MLIVRPIAFTDLEDLYELAVKAGNGMTSLPKNRKALEGRIRSSVDSFARTEKHGDDFFLLVMEELTNKCREAIMTNDQDIAARGGWRPPSPPPMSTAEETRDREKEIRREARSRHQVVVGGWAPSLRRAV